MFLPVVLVPPNTKNFIKAFAQSKKPSVPVKFLLFEDFLKNAFVVCLLGLSSLLFISLVNTPSRPLPLILPVPNVSLVEFIFCTKKEITTEQINKAFLDKVQKQKKKILEITNEKLVSVDFNHSSASAIVDTTLTNNVGKNMGKVSAWYDNEWGFSNRMCDIAEYLNHIK